MSALQMGVGHHRYTPMEWIPIVLGLLVLYGPTCYELATTVWQTDDAQGPLILAIIAWLTWRARSALIEAPTRTAPLAGFGLLFPGLLLYMLGRSQDVPIIEVGSLVPVLGGTLLAMRGWVALRALWFPLLFVVFLVPLPASLVDALTGALKQQVSAGAEHLLYGIGVPVARNGVVLQVGQYQLLVADACSGLNSMISLSALGLLYLNLVRRRSWLHNGLVAASIVPIAFSANVVRVAVLALVTYYWGDAAGQGFLHGAAGIVLVMAALLLILAVDGGLARILRAGTST